MAKTIKIIVDGREIEIPIADDSSDPVIMIDGKPITLDQGDGTVSSSGFNTLKVTVDGREIEIPAGANSVRWSPTLDADMSNVIGGQKLKNDAYYYPPVIVHKRRGLFGCGIGSLIGLIVLIIIALSVAAFVPLMSWAFGSVTEVGDVANKVMLALRDKNYSDLYEMLTGDEQSSYRSSEQLASSINNREMPEISDWKFGNFSIRNEFGNISGQVTFANGETSNLSMLLYNTGKAWKVTSVTFFMESGTRTLW